MGKILNESVKFTATMEITYIPNSAYQVEVKFGRRKILFDQMEWGHNIDQCVDALSMRDDIQNLTQVIYDFVDVATDLQKQFFRDSFKQIQLYESK